VRSTACCAALWACSVAALAGEATAATTSRLALGQSFTDLEVSSTGQAWLTARRGDYRGAWTMLDGAPRWRTDADGNYGDLPTTVKLGR
jgi:hypothetical protein